MEIINGINSEEHLKLVSMKIRSMNVPSYLRKDAFQEGAVGLMYAVHNYKSEYGFEFSTYATAHITWRILRLLRENSNRISPKYISLDALNLDWAMSKDKPNTKLEGEILDAITVDSYFVEEWSEISELLQQLLKEKHKDSVWFYLLYTLEGKTLQEIKDISKTKLSTNTIQRRIHRGKRIIFARLKDKYKEIFNHDPIQLIIESLKKRSESDSSIESFLSLCELNGKISNDHPGFLKIKSEYPNCYNTIIKNLDKG